MALATKGVTTKFTLTGTTPVQLAAAKSPNEDRKSLFIVNRDATYSIEFAYHVGTAANFPSGGGIVVPPGGSWIEGDYDQQRVNNGDVWAACTTNNNPIISYTED